MHSQMGLIFNYASRVKYQPHFRVIFITSQRKEWRKKPVFAFDDIVRNSH